MFPESYSGKIGGVKKDNPYIISSEFLAGLDKTKSKDDLYFNSYHNEKNLYLDYSQKHLQVQQDQRSYLTDNRKYTSIQKRNSDNTIRNSTVNIHLHGSVKLNNVKFVNCKVNFFDNRQIIIQRPSLLERIFDSLLP